MDDQVSLFKLCYGGVQSYWEVKAEDFNEAINYINEENTRASDEVIRGLVEALYEIITDANGYESRSGKTVSWTKRGEQALSQARKHLQSEK